MAETIFDFLKKNPLEWLQGRSLLPPMAGPGTAHRIEPGYGTGRVKPRVTYDPEAYRHHRDPKEDWIPLPRSGKPPTTLGPGPAPPQPPASIEEALREMVRATGTQPPEKKPLDRKSVSVVNEDGVHMLVDEGSFLHRKYSQPSAGASDASKDVPVPSVLPSSFSSQPSRSASPVTPSYLDEVQDERSIYEDPRWKALNEMLPRPNARRRGRPRIYSTAGQLRGAIHGPKNYYRNPASGEMTRITSPGQAAQAYAAYNKEVDEYNSKVQELRSKERMRLMVQLMDEKRQEQSNARFAQAAAGAMGVSPQRFRGMSRSEVMDLIGIERKNMENRTKAEQESVLAGYLRSMFKDKWGVELDPRVKPSGIGAIDSMLQEEQDRVQGIDDDMSRARASQAVLRGDFHHPDVAINMSPESLAVQVRSELENRQQLEKEEERRKKELFQYQQKHEEMLAKNFELTSSAVDAYRSVAPVMKKGGEGLAAKETIDHAATDLARKSAAREVLTQFRSGFRRQGVSLGLLNQRLNQLVAENFQQSSGSQSQSALAAVHAGKAMPSHKRVDSVADIFNLEGAALEMALNRLMGLVMELQQKGATRAGSTTSQ